MKIKHIASVGILASLFILTASAQTTSEISGRVTDPPAR